MQNSISKKLFIITFSLILGVFFITLSFQFLFFEDFYLSQKTKDLVTSMNRFRTLYSYEISNERTLATALVSYEESNNSRIAIFSLDGKMNYLTNYKDNVEDLKSLTFFCEELLSDKSLIDEVISNNEVKSTIFTNQSTGSKKIGIVSPMSLKSKNDSILISVSSIQPIQEAASVIRTFYIYLLIGFLIVAVFLSKIYVNLIGNPLFKINAIAKRMSSLDFDARCEITSNDEIGNLAKTLNFLSSNLKASLDNLKDKNIKLEREIEKERKLENMRKDFVTSVSHDLKTPIGIISGYAEGLRDGIVTGDEMNVYLETIIDEAYKMNSLVTSMVELSKLDSNDTAISLETFNLIRLIKAMIKRLSGDIKKKNLNVEFTNSPEYAYINADVLKMEQVIQNLLVNAIKYSPEGNHIYISIEEIEENYHVSIENTGIHIPDTELENVFAKFYRLDKSGDRTKNNFGLGLAIVKRILELHGSEYSISNTERGVIFKFTLSKCEEEFE